MRPGPTDSIPVRARPLSPPFPVSPVSPVKGPAVIRRLTLTLTAVTVFLTLTVAAGTVLPPISGPLSDLQIEGPLIQSIML